MSDSANLVRDFFKCINREGVRTATSRFCAPDYVWWSPGVGNVQDQLADTYELMLQSIDESGISLTVHATTSERDRVAVEAESKCRLKNGVLYNNNYHFLVLMRGDKIVQVKEYNDTKHASDVWSSIFAGLPQNGN